MILRKVTLQSQCFALQNRVSYTCYTGFGTINQAVQTAAEINQLYQCLPFECMTQDFKSNKHF